MKIENLKGEIIAIGEDEIIVLSNKTNLEHVVKRDKEKEYKVGQLVNMIIQQSECADKPVNLIGDAKIVKKKAIKIVNFSSLIKQMNKFNKRLTENLDDAFANDAEEEVIRNLSEKIDYLEKGIDLFSI